MAKVKVYAVYGLGFGCHKEIKHAFEVAGADPELVHYNELLWGLKDLFKSKALILVGGFFQGDIISAAACAANQLEQAVIVNKAVEETNKNERFKDQLLRYADIGNIIYGQCNGFQLQVKTGLLPGINNDYSKQTATLTNNDCGDYYVDFVPHKIENGHFAFEGINDTDFYLWCRHGEGKLLFHSKYGLITKEEGEKNRETVNEKQVLLRYTRNPNGSIDDIAGLVNENGNIFGHMAHTEVGVYRMHDPRWYKLKDQLRRLGFKAKDLTDDRLLDKGSIVFKNIVNYLK